MPLLFYDHPHAFYKSRSITETWQGGGRGSNSDNDSNFRYVFTQPLLYQTKLFILQEPEYNRDMAGWWQGE